MQAYIDLIQEEEKEKYGDSYVPPTENNPAGPRATVSSPPPSQQPSTPASTKPTPNEEPRAPSLDLTTEDDPDTWTCGICTLVNPNQFLTCDACTTERPSMKPTHPSRPSSANTKRVEEREKPNALKPRQSVVRSLTTLEAQEASKPAKPMGWLCHVCNNWMESEWWTCARCGNMKQVS